MSADFVHSQFPRLGCSSILVAKLEDVWRNGNNISVFLASPLPSFIPLQHVAAMELLSKFARHSLAALFSFLYGTLSGKEVLQLESTRGFYNPSINNGLEVEDKQQQDADVAQYSSRNKLLMEFLVNNEERAWASVILESLYVWQGWLLTLCDLHEQGTRSVTIPTARGRYLLPRCGAKSQVGQNYFRLGNPKIPGSFERVTSVERAFQYVCPVSPMFVFN